MNVEVALIPAAGRGTRMRPATNAIPKALLTVVDRPGIQWVVEEAARAGVTEVVVVVDPDGGDIIYRHFEESLYLPSVADVKVRTIVQSEAKGLGHAVLTGQEAIGLRPFFVLLADDLIRPSDDILTGLARAAHPDRSAVYVRKVSDRLLGAKGVVETGEWVSPSVMNISGAVEKPGHLAAPSNYAIHGRYLFTPEIFDYLAGLSPGYDGEVQLTDAIAELGAAGRCRAYLAEVDLFDVGNPLGFLQANTVLGLDDPNYRTGYQAIIDEIRG
ncbi:MAG: NTP transferase domain-containing protein [Acidimicrobiia bacterium]|nr:NTP transferase domain-containing protein [Acidimicrobiia bacterium]